MGDLGHLYLAGRYDIEPLRRIAFREDVVFFLERGRGDVMVQFPEFLIR